MRHVRRYVTVWLNIFVLTACSPVAYTSQPSAGTLTAIPNPTATISNLALTLSHPIPTSAPPTRVDSECLGTKQNLPEDIAGVWVLSGSYYLYKPELKLHQDPTYILAPDTGDKIDLPVSDGSDFSISPDRQWLAYYVEGESLSGALVIVGNNGKLVKKYPVNNWWGIQKWIDDGHLLISKFSDKNPFPTLVFNAFTGESKQELLPNYPDIFSGAHQELYSWGKYELPETVYNSDLSLVIYPTDTTTKNPRRKIVLWDLKDGKVLNEIVDTWATGRAPLYLSDQKAFVVNVSTSQNINRPNQDELMRVSIDGQVRQLTRLLDLGYQNVAIQNFSESADGRYIAFWFAQINVGPSRLAVYDIEMEKTQVFCAVIGGYIAPVWSPSGNQLLVDGTFDNLDNYGTVFVDVEEGILAQVEKGVIPVGWMVIP